LVDTPVTTADAPAVRSLAGSNGFTTYATEPSSAAVIDAYAEAHVSPAGMPSSVKAVAKKPSAAKKNATTRSSRTPTRSHPTD